MSDDRGKAAEIIVLANHLLRIVDVRLQAKQQAPLWSRVSWCSATVTPTQAREHHGIGPLLGASYRRQRV
jgi:hypothetical protein